MNLFNRTNRVHLVIYNFRNPDVSNTLQQSVRSRVVLDKYFHLKCIIIVKIQDPFIFFLHFIEASRSAGVQVSDCKRDWLWVQFLFNLYFNFFALVSRQSAALRSTTQHAMLLEFGEKWETECLNTRFLCLPCRVRDTA